MSNLVIFKKASMTLGNFSGFILVIHQKPEILTRFCLLERNYFITLIADF